jgi:hypothetical protein
MQATDYMTGSRTCDNTSKRRFHPDTDVDSIARRCAAIEGQ